MKRFIVVLIIVVAALFVVTYIFQDKGFGTYSEGYRMGKLNKLSTTGLIFKSIEGDLLLGNESSYYFDSKDSVLVNPWQFSLSTTSALVSQIEKYSNKYVVIKYRQYQLGPLNWETDYEPVEIMDVDPLIQILPCEVSDVSGNKSEGFRVGRVVKISNKGTISKTYEITFQLSDVGNDFMKMSVSNDRMYNTLLSALKSGKKVIFYYKKKLLSNPLQQETDYLVWKVEEAYK